MDMSRPLRPKTANGWDHVRPDQIRLGLCAAMYALALISGYVHHTAIWVDLCPEVDLSRLVTMITRVAGGTPKSSACSIRVWYVVLLQLAAHCPMRLQFTTAISWQDNRGQINIPDAHWPTSLPGLLRLLYRARHNAFALDGPHPPPSWWRQINVALMSRYISGWYRHCVDLHLQAPWAFIACQYQLIRTDFSLGKYKSSSVTEPSGRNLCPLYRSDLIYCKVYVACTSAWYTYGPWSGSV
jgi:hypothetical protein